MKQDSTTSTIGSFSPSPANSQTKSNITGGDIVFVSTAVLLTIAIMLSQLYPYMPKLKAKKNSSKLISQLKCERCQYFNSNLYLKCAVRPADVMSSRAIDCRDYQPKNAMTEIEKKIDNIRKFFNLRAKI